MAQLVERSLPFPEVCSSNPVISKNLYWTFFCQLYWKDEKRKRNWDGPIFEKTFLAKYQIHFMLLFKIFLNLSDFTRGSQLPKSVLTAIITGGSPGLVVMGGDSFQRSWVQIPVPYTGWTFYTSICCKNGNVCWACVCENKWKRGQDQPIFNVIIVWLVIFPMSCAWMNSLTSNLRST